MDYVAETINANFKTDHEEFLYKYMLPLLGIDAEAEITNLGRSEVYSGEKAPAVEQIENRLNFHISQWRVFSVPVWWKFRRMTLPLQARSADAGTKIPSWSFLMPGGIPFACWRVKGRWESFRWSLH